MGFEPTTFTLAISRPPIPTAVIKKDLHRPGKSTCTESCTRHGRDPTTSLVDAIRIIDQLPLTDDEKADLARALRGDFLRNRAEKV